MAKKKNTNEVEQLVEKEFENVAAPVEDNAAEQVKQEEDIITEPTEMEAMQTAVAQLEARVAELEDLKLRQMAEFDNFRRRTNKEKLELMTTAGERIFKDMLPLVDDFERAKEAMVKTDDIEAVRQGIELIYSKFLGFLAANDVKAIDTTDADFNTDLHEAITTFAAGEDKKGKVIDCTQKGYTLGEKVIRFSKVVVGE
jgi:molecular chaperone GrpE